MAVMVAGAAARGEELVTRDAGERAPKQAVTNSLAGHTVCLHTPSIVRTRQRTHSAGKESGAGKAGFDCRGEAVRDPTGIPARYPFPHVNEIGAETRT